MMTPSTFWLELERPPMAEPMMARFMSHDPKLTRYQLKVVSSESKQMVGIKSVMNGQVKLKARVKLKSSNIENIHLVNRSRVNMSFGSHLNPTMKLFQ